MQKNSKTSKERHKFLSTKRWKDFRVFMATKYKVDCITGSKLVKGRWNLHHCDLDKEHYEDLEEENFRCLNPQSHDCVHFLYNTKDWRKTLKNIENILLFMEQLNKKGEEE